MPEREGEVITKFQLLGRGEGLSRRHDCSGITDSVLMFDTVQTKYNLNDRLFLPALRRTTMNMSMNIAVEPLLALVIGILILLVPRFLNYFVAVYLIVVGILGLMHHPLT